ncbi:MAG TPA: DUF4139 domain-containing protein [Phycisphaerae bacterium]|nr:DUF4139 domain-containing protein [Phycisphaerae bacterium]
MSAPARFHACRTAGVLVFAIAAALPAWAQPAAEPATQPAAPATAATEKRPTVDVPVRRVVLFSSGVGFFQHSGTVTGNAATELRFKTDQINDVLKSLVVADADAGRVTSITYPSQNPVAKTLKSFQIDISNNPSLADILNQVRGAKVTIKLSDQSLTGTILGVESKDRPVGGKDDQKVVKTWYLDLIAGADEGIHSIQLDDVLTLTLDDPALQSELNQALAALAQARDKDKKPVIVNFDGTGERRVAIGYVVETPVWKTSYRLILPEQSSKDSANLMAWAIIENQTDNDWKNIQLDLVGGRPISFIEDLYQPLYAPRPVVQPRLYASLTPQTYDEGMADKAAAAPAPAAAMSPPGAGGGFGGGGGRGGLRQSQNSAFSTNGAVDVPTYNLQAAKVAEPAPANYTQGVTALADATKVGEMFQYSVANVSLPRQRSAMIPIITGQLPFDRVSIYNQSVLPRNPLHGVRLKNDSKNYLLAGPVTVLDMVKSPDGRISQSYAGDASIDDVPPGQERLLSYGVDQDALVDADKHDTKNSLMTGQIVNGVLRLQYLDRTSQTYEIENKSDLPKDVIIEHPRSPDFTLKTPEKPLEKTDKLYRFETTVAPKASASMDVVEERTRWEELAILNLDITGVDYWAKNDTLPGKVKDALAKAGDMQRKIADLNRQRQTAESDRSSILQDQDNLRKNINAFPSGSKSRTDAVNALSDKQTELDDTNKHIKDLQNSLEKAHSDLESYLSALNVK